MEELIKAQILYLGEQPLSPYLQFYNRDSVKAQVRIIIVSSSSAAYLSLGCRASNFSRQAQSLLLLAIATNPSGRIQRCSRAQQRDIISLLCPGSRSPPHGHAQNTSLGRGLGIGIGGRIALFKAIMSAAPL